MAAADDVDDLIGRFHQALDEFVKGHPEPCKELLFHREDVTLNNPFLALPHAAGTRSPLP